MPTPEVPEVYVTSLDTLADEYKTENKKFAEWFAKDKDKLVNDIHRMRDNTYFRKVILYLITQMFQLMRLIYQYQTIFEKSI